MTISTMFLNEMTVVDHAYIDADGFINGGSFNPSFIVSGEVDETEQVVVDFSAIKKEIKAIIDDKETGFDHKLWISRQSSNLVSVDKSPKGDSHIHIVTPHVELHLPANAVKFFNFTSYERDEIGKFFASQLTAELKKKYPSIEVECRNSVTPHTVKFPIVKGNILSNPVPVSYFHGLKNSSSFGCKSLAHGHLSFVQMEFEPNAVENLDKIRQLEEKIFTDWGNKMYIFSENLVGGNEIAYDTEMRGYFSCKFSDDCAKKIFNTETTIENLVAHLRAEYLEEFKSYGVKYVYFSEGLSKGAVAEI